MGGHAIRTAAAVEGRAGDTMMVALRPEMITLDGIDGEPVPNANRVPATVLDVAFLGSVGPRQYEHRRGHVRPRGYSSTIRTSPCRRSDHRSRCHSRRRHASCWRKTPSPRESDALAAAEAMLVAGPRATVDLDGHRAHRLRQGRHAHRLPRDVEWLGDAPRRRPGSGHQPTGPRTVVHDAGL